MSSTQSTPAITMLISSRLTFAVDENNAASVLSDVSPFCLYIKKAQRAVNLAAQCNVPYYCLQIYCNSYIWYYLAKHHRRPPHCTCVSPLRHLCRRPHRVVLKLLSSADRPVTRTRIANNAIYTLNLCSLLLMDVLIPYCDFWAKVILSTFAQTSARNMYINALNTYNYMSTMLGYIFTLFASNRNGQGVKTSQEYNTSLLHYDWTLDHT